MRFRKIKTGNPLVIQPFDPNSVSDSVLSDDTFSLTSPAFSHGDEMPRKFGWKNGNISPPLVISGIPAVAKSLALIMDDPDAMGAVGKVWVHWVMWNVGTSAYDEQAKWSKSFSPEQRKEAEATYFWQLLQDCLPNRTTIIIPEGSGWEIPQDQDLRQTPQFVHPAFLYFTGAVFGITDFGNAGNGYGGPAPPDKRHTYVFKLYALDTKLDLEAGASKADVEKAMEGHIIEQTQLTGTYAP